MRHRCDVVLPCRNEAAALPGVVGALPPGIRPIVVDNASIDGTARVAERLGIMVVREERPGYGAAVHAGVLAATAPLVAVMDADGSMDPADLMPLVDDVESGRASMSIGVRSPTSRTVWPWHARIGNRLLLAWLRRRSGIEVHDIAAMRVCRRADLLGLEIADRRFGYPLELLLRAHAAGWTVLEHDIGYGPRASGSRSKVSGSFTGTLKAARDFAEVLR